MPARRMLPAGSMFWKYPDLMAQWPFAHEYEMTYSLAGGALEVRTTISNLSTEAMPVVMGFHSFLPDSRHARAMSGWRTFRRAYTSSPTSTTFRRARCGRSTYPIHCRSAGVLWMTVFTDLERDADGRAHFSIESGGKTVETLLDPGTPSPPSGCRRDRMDNHGSSSASSLCPRSSAG